MNDGNPEHDPAVFCMENTNINQPETTLTMLSADKPCSTNHHFYNGIYI